MDAYVAEIKIFPYGRVPRGWALCNGQLLPIAQNTALFALLGVQYGGDGRTTFALPNLQGIVPVGQGQGQGLQQWTIAKQQGTTAVTLQQSEMAAHYHGLTVTSSEATQTSAGSNQLGTGTGGSLQAPSVGKMYSSGQPNVQLATQSLNPQGGSQPHNNMMPYLGFSFCIALQGIFPSRS